MSVDLPDPLCPMIAINSPFFMLKFTSFSASNTLSPSLNFLLKFLSSIKFFKILP